MTLFLGLLEIIPDALGMSIILLIGWIFNSALYGIDYWIDSNLIGVGINLVISIIFIIAASTGVIKNKRREYQ